MTDSIITLDDFVERIVQAREAEQRRTSPHLAIPDESPAAAFASGVRAAAEMLLPAQAALQGMLSDVVEECRAEHRRPMSILERVANDVARQAEMNVDDVRAGLLAWARGDVRDADDESGASAPPADGEPRPLPEGFTGYSRTPLSRDPRTGEPVDAEGDWLTQCRVTARGVDVYDFGHRLLRLAPEALTTDTGTLLGAFEVVDARIQWHERPTDGERFSRSKFERDRLARHEEWERRTYEKLKAKFDPAEREKSASDADPPHRSMTQW